MTGTALLILTGYSGRLQVETLSIGQLKVSVVLLASPPGNPVAMTNCTGIEIDSVLEKVFQLTKQALKEESSPICLKRLILTLSLIWDIINHNMKKIFKNEKRKREE